MTTASHPEITFAYPGNGMANLDPGTEIKVRYNQNVLTGPAFESIALYRSGYGKVAAQASIEDEWLYIRPIGLLSPVSEYTLSIPEGAVRNADDETQLENYELVFTTNPSDDGGNNGSPSDDEDSSAPSGGRDNSTPLPPRQGNPVSRDENGSVIIDINPENVSGADKETDVTIDLTDEVKNDEVIQ